MTFEERVRNWCVTHLAEEMHWHPDGYHRNGNCFNLSDEALTFWDIYMDGSEAYQYSEYTADGAHAYLNAKMPLTCGPVLDVVIASDGDVITRFHQLIRDLCGS